MTASFAVALPRGKPLTPCPLSLKGRGEGFLIVRDCMEFSLTDKPYENIIVDKRLRPEMVRGSVGPMASKNFTICLRAASSFQARPRR